MDALAGGAVTVSVAMTTYNAGPHLAAQLASVVEQTHPPDEVVVHDDGSTDETWARLQDFASRSAVPFTLARNDHNIGLRQNVEAAMRACHGEVVVLADQDDVWESGKIDAVRSAFAAPDVMLWFSDAALIDTDGLLTGGTAWEALRFLPEDRTAMLEGHGIERLLHGQVVTGATMAVRRAVVQLALPLPDELEGAEHLFLHDGWLAVLAYCLGPGVADPTPHTRYRQHAGQVTAMSLVGALPSHTAAPVTSQLNLEAARCGLVARRIKEAAARGPRVAELLDRARYLDGRQRLRRGSPRAGVQLLRSGAYTRYGNGGRSLLRDVTVGAKAALHRSAGDE